jgi:benzoate/toluate 1,2-dioxygenase beta subunit
MSAVAKPKPAGLPADLREVEQFLYHEARLIDEQRWQEWADLFAKDGEYWVPATPGQPDPVNHVSLIYETDLLRAVRVKRYSHPNAFSLQPKPRSAHLVTNVMLDGTNDAGDLVVNSRFIMIQYRREEQRLYGGTYRHHLRAVEGGYRIALKKVELVNCDAPLDNILIVL